MHKYVDIERMKEKYAVAFTQGEKITVSVKIDGANASFTYDPNTASIKAFSRKTELDESNTLRGFWNLTQQFPIDVVKSVTQDGRYVIYGEWLVPHTVKYAESMYKKFYMFDIYDTVSEHYMPHSFTYGAYEMLKALGCDIEFVPILFTGAFTSWDDLMKYVGVSHTGASPCDEGIVVKTQCRLEDAHSSKSPKYLKIVAEKFSEVQQDHQKSVDPEALKAKAEVEAFVASIATERRAEKIIEKMIDNEIIPIDWDEHDMKTIAKNIPRLMYEDCLKEEHDFVIKCENFGKICASLSMKYVRKMLNEKSQL